MGAFEHLQYLVNQCGDRRVGTPGNEMAAEYITRVMESAGYDCERQTFRTPGGIQAPNAAILLMGFAASLLRSMSGRPARAAGLGLATLMAASILGENTTLYQPAHHLVPRRNGRNVLARPEASHAPKVVVVAHFDTVNEGTAFNSRWVRFVPAGLKAYASFPFLALLLSRPGWRWPGRFFRLAMLVGAAQMVQWQLLGNHNPGANDNGSSVAVALQAAERLGVAEESRCDIWFLFTDGEEAGITGMRAFIERHAGALSDAVIVNLEAQGSGELCYLGYEGMLMRFRPPAEFLSLVETYTGTTPIAVRMREVPSFTTDALAALARGLAAVTLVRLDAGGFITGWHYHDHLEHIDKTALDESVDYVAGLAPFLREMLNQK